MSMHAKDKRVHRLPHVSTKNIRYEGDKATPISKGREDVSPDVFFQPMPISTDLVEKRAVGCALSLKFERPNRRATPYYPAGMWE